MLRYRKSPLALATLALATFVFLPSLASAAITGTVHNGTTNSVGANVDVVLIALQSDMQTVANTKTDTQGHFSLNYTPAGAMPMLVRAVYKGVNFHAMLPPGQSTANVEIYEPETAADGIQFTGRLIVFQPQGNSLIVGEVYEIQNQSSPPKAFFKTDGNFEFSVPDGAQISDVSASGPERMPVTQGTMPRGANKFAIAYPFRPGENAVRMSYQLSYPGNRATIKIPSAYSVARAVIFVPPTVTLTADGFQAAGSEQGMTVYTRDNLLAGTDFTVSLSGTAPPPSDTQQDPNAAQSGSANGRDTGAPIATVPPRLDQLKWILLAGFGTFFILGAVYLWRRPVPATANGSAQSAATFIPAKPARSKRNSSLDLTSRSADASPSHAATAPSDSAPDAPVATLADFDRGTSTSLDELKDMLFKLELRHQAGTISEDEYAAQRARAEKILRDLVRG